MTKARLETLNTIYWGDCHFNGLKFSVLKDSVTICMKVKSFKDYEAMRDKSSTKIVREIKFIDVLSWQLSCDVDELLSNKSTGEISNGHFKICQNERKRGILTLRIFLCFGYIEINSREVEVTELGTELISK